MSIPEFCILDNLQICISSKNSQLWPWLLEILLYMYMPMIYMLFFLFEGMAAASFLLWQLFQACRSLFVLPTHFLILIHMIIFYVLYAQQNTNSTPNHNNLGGQSSLTFCILLKDCSLQYTILWNTASKLGE